MSQIHQTHQTRPSRIGIAAKIVRRLARLWSVWAERYRSVRGGDEFGDDLGAHHGSYHGPYQGTRQDAGTLRALTRQMRMLGLSAAREIAARADLWAPVATGLGVILYFSLRSEPPSAFSAVMMVLAAGLALIARSGRWHIPMAAIACVALGFAAADWRAAMVDAPIIDGNLSVRTIEGRLISVDEGPGRRRLIIAPDRIDFLEPSQTPARVRVNWRGKVFDAQPGDRVSIKAGLSPPPGAVAPGAYPFSRQLYFERIGAVGFAVSAPTVLPDRSPPLSARIDSFIEGVRLTLARRIIAAAPGEGGAIVAAVVTGKRGAISDSARDALRDAGLAHLLAISGLHMGLATGIVFFSVRFALACYEPWALNYPIKKWAAGLALAAGLIYLLLSGGGWSARRAFIMTSIIFIAILTDRRAFSLRNVAVAAMIIILTTPEAVLHPGFQMSFAAVTALIAAYEWAEARQGHGRGEGVLVRLRRYAIGIGVTDTIAALATAPFGLYHFHRAAIYSLPANLAAMPLMGLWIMPMVVVGLLAIPIGLDGIFWRLAAWGMELVVGCARMVASQPGAVATSPYWPPAALGIVVMGGLVVCLLRGRIRFLGLAAFPLAALIVINAPIPFLFINRDGDNVGIVTKTNRDEPVLAMIYPRRDGFAAGGWIELAGGNPDETAILPAGDVFACDPAGCIVPMNGEVISILSDRLALGEDCVRADRVIALFSVTRAEAAACAAELTTFWDVYHAGSHILVARGARNILVTNRDRSGTRPWSAR